VRDWCLLALWREPPNDIGSASSVAQFNSRQHSTWGS